MEQRVAAVADPESGDKTTVRGDEGGKGHDREHGIEELISQLFHTGLAYMDREFKQYFEHLDTKLFIRRCVRSVFPSTRYEDLLNNPDFYGPLVLTFALSSCLHFAFKKADPAPLDRHLGISLLLCFGSLVVGSLLIDVAWQYSASMAKQSPAKYGLDRAICIVGYSFVGPCVVMLLDGRLWNFLFIPVALGFEMGSALSFGTATFRASQGQSHALGIVCAILHVFWLYHLRGMLNSFDGVIAVAG